jgi:hypothetical protein
MYTNMMRASSMTAIIVFLRPAAERPAFVSWDEKHRHGHHRQRRR